MEQIDFDDVPVVEVAPGQRKLITVGGDMILVRGVPRAGPGPEPTPLLPSSPPEPPLEEPSPGTLEALRGPVTMSRETQGWGDVAAFETIQVTLLKDPADRLELFQRRLSVVAILAEDDLSVAGGEELYGAEELMMEEGDPSESPGAARNLEA